MTISRLLEGIMFIIALAFLPDILCDKLGLQKSVGQVIEERKHEAIIPKL